MKRILSTLTTCLSIMLVVIACAKQRPIVTLSDPESEKLSKSAFLDTIYHSKITIVRQSPNGGLTFVGEQSGIKTGHFEFTKEKLKFINDVIPYSKLSSSATPELINEWDITHSDTRLAVADGNVTNKEEEDADKSWNQKRNFKINFSTSAFGESSMFPFRMDGGETGCWAKKSTYLVKDSLKIEADAINFIVGADYQLNGQCNNDIRREIRGDAGFSVQYLYSFRKAVKTLYKPFSYKGETDPRMKDFGYFQTIAESINEQNADFKTTILMNRWDPQTEHHYYFSEDFPAKYKWIFNEPKTGIFAITNQLMEKNSLKARFYIHENTWGDNQAKRFGDLRYSFIKFVDEMDDNAPLGYGPTDAHPYTGELLAGNLVIWTGYINSYVAKINEIKARQQSKFQSSSIFVDMASALEEPDHASWTSHIDPQSTSGKLFYDLLPQLTFGYPAFAPFTATPRHGSKSAAHVVPQKFLDAMTDQTGVATIQEIQNTLEEVQTQEIKDVERSRHASVYPIEPVLAAIPDLVASGETPEFILNAILYRTALHEFGHNLGLRHNFYGSVDQRNFHAPIPVLDASGNPVLDAGGKPKVWEQKTSSIMDYLHVKDEIHLGFNWEPYDEAALLFAYSDGALKQQKTYLFCTDEHTILNALCNQWDSGSSPSEIMMSLIANYEDSYQFRNYRRDRAYWNTSGYRNSAASSMKAFKKFVPLWQTAYTDEKVLAAAKNLGLADTDAATITESSAREFKKAIRLSLAFYQSLFHTKNADRPYQDEFDNFSGAKKRQGIFWDKLFALNFLVGDGEFNSDPNTPMGATSYLSYKREPEFEKLLTAIYDSILSTRGDMPSWVIGFGRSLYAATSTDAYNVSNSSLVDKIRVSSRTKEEMQKNLGISLSSERNTSSAVVRGSDDTYFKAGEEIGYTLYNGRYLVVSKSRNPYAYSVFSQVALKYKDERSETVMKMDLLDLHNLYLLATQDNSGEGK